MIKNYGKHTNNFFSFFNIHLLWPFSLSAIAQVRVGRGILILHQGRFSVLFIAVCLVFGPGIVKMDFFAEITLLC